MRIQVLVTATVLALTAAACSPAEDKAPAPALAEWAGRLGASRRSSASPSCARTSPCAGERSASCARIPGTPGLGRASRWLPAR